MTEKEYAKYLWELISPHADYWDCYNDEPLEEDHTMELCNLFLAQQDFMLLTVGDRKYTIF